MQQAFFSSLERVLRLGPAPRRFPNSSRAYVRLGAAICGGLMMLFFTSIILAQIT